MKLFQIIYIQSHLHIQTKGKWCYQLHKRQTQLPRIFPFNSTLECQVCSMFVLAWSVNWSKSCLGSLSLRWLKFSFTESPADSFNFIGRQPWRPLWLVRHKSNHPTFSENSWQLCLTFLQLVLSSPFNIKFIR